MCCLCNPSKAGSSGKCQVSTVVKSPMYHQRKCVTHPGRYLRAFCLCSRCLLAFGWGVKKTSKCTPALEESQVCSYGQNRCFCFVLTSTVCFTWTTQRHGRRVNFKISVQSADFIGNAVPHSVKEWQPLFAPVLYLYSQNVFLDQKKHVCIVK